VAWQIETTGDRRSAITKWGVFLTFLYAVGGQRDHQENSKAGSVSIFSKKGSCNDFTAWFLCHLCFFHSCFLSDLLLPSPIFSIFNLQHIATIITSGMGL